MVGYLKLFFKRFISDNSGATAIEYGLILAGLCVFIMIAVFTMGEDLAMMFSTLSDEMQEHVPED